MVWLLILLAVGIVVAIGRKAMGGGPSETAAPAPDIAPMAPVVVALPPPAPPPVPAPARAAVNVLQPFSPIPLTVEEASPEGIAALRTILDDDKSYGQDKQDRVLEWLLTTNARVREIDAFLAKYGPIYAAAVKATCEADPDWATAGELDRSDIEAGAGLKALDQLDVRVRDLDYEMISEPPGLEAAADDPLIARYGFPTLSFYFRYADNLDQVLVARSEDWYRPRFEALVAKGLAKRGVDIAPSAVLQTMTLKTMEEVAAGMEHKHFTRRAPAIEFLANLSDLRERLGRHVSLRELFQLLPLGPDFSHLDLDALSHAWAYAGEYAKLLATTYEAADRAHQTASQNVLDEYAKGWVVENPFGDAPCCPTCAKRCGEHRGARVAAPKLPHHVGCSCRLSQIYE